MINIIDCLPRNSVYTDTITHPNSGDLEIPEVQLHESQAESLYLVNPH